MKSGRMALHCIGGATITQDEHVPTATVCWAQTGARVVYPLSVLGGWCWGGGRKHNLRASVCHGPSL